MRHYDELFGKLAEPDRQHILALTSEHECSDAGFEAHWSKMAEILGAMDGEKQRAALIWRHMADPARNSVSSSASLYYLKKCVALDPEQRDTQLSLIRALRDQGDPALL